MNDLKGQLDSSGDRTSEALKIVTSLEQQMSARLEQRQARQSGQADTGLRARERREGLGSMTPLREARNGGQLRSDSYQHNGPTPSNGL